MPQVVFPRAKLPAKASGFRVPTGLASWGQTGKGQFRSTAQVGREWVEEWGLLEAQDPEVRSLLAWIEWAWNTRQVFTIQHLTTPGSGRAPGGTGGGTPVVAGAGQTGNTIATDGWLVSTSGVVAAGDVILFAGDSLLYRVVEDASSDAGGAATLTVNPPVPAGSAPADNAAITTENNALSAVIASEPDVPTASGPDLLAGLKLTFREQP